MGNKGRGYKTVDGVYISPTHPEGNRATRRAKAKPFHYSNKKETKGRIWNMI